jgi:hypothetical protein
VGATSGHQQQQEARRDSTVAADARPLLGQAQVEQVASTPLVVPAGPQPEAASAVSDEETSVVVSPDLVEMTKLPNRDAIKPTVSDGSITSFPVSRSRGRSIPQTVVGFPIQSIPIQVAQVAQPMPQQVR